MTQDEIIAMAKEAGFEFEMQQALSGEHLLFTDGSVSIGRMQRLVALVTEKAAAEEREACAKLCDATVMQSVLNSYDAGWVGGAETCADRIRARGQKEGV